MTSRLFTFLACVLSVCGYAQELEVPLMYNPVQMEQWQENRAYPMRVLNRAASLDLPFFDDFSRYSLLSNDPSIPADWQRWEDNYVFINTDFPIEPPSIGVATFDGLDSTGYPYDFENVAAYGLADALTSLPINLNGFNDESAVHLMFFYQAQGLGNAPEPEDSLVLEFYSPVGGGYWDRVWSVKGRSAGDFEQVFIPITDVNFLLDGFQFRFRNYATLSGNLDHWHVDYVILDEGIDPDNFGINDLAYMDNHHGLLDTYTAMPWTHFKSNPESFMLETTVGKQRNLGEAVNFTSAFQVEYEDQLWLRTTPPNTGGNGYSIITTDHDVNTGNNPFVFDTSVNDTCALFTVKFTHEESDFFQMNDTATFVQDFTNYYAYDDGTAERGYRLNVAGGKVAVRHTTAVTDSLLGLFIHFTPSGQNSSLESFLLRVWEDKNGLPGDQIYEMYRFHSPKYFTNGYNVFAYYEYDVPVEVSGSFFVGYSQLSDVKLDLGNDKNINTNTANLYYQLGTGVAWQRSDIPGSVMIRPVFKAGKSRVWNSLTEISLEDIKLYPNPVEDFLTLELGPMIQNITCSLYDLSGREMATISKAQQHLVWDLSDLVSGMYMMVIQDQNGAVLATEKIVKR